MARPFQERVTGWPWTFGRWMALTMKENGVLQISQRLSTVESWNLYCVVTLGKAFSAIYACIWHDDLDLGSRSQNTWAHVGFAILVMFTCIHVCWWLSDKSFASRMYNSILGLLLDLHSVNCTVLYIHLSLYGCSIGSSSKSFQSQNPCLIIWLCS